MHVPFKPKGFRRRGVSTLDSQPLGGEYIALKSAIHRMEQRLIRERQASERRLEDYWALQSFLSDGKLPPRFQGWAISPELGLQLIETLSNGDLDCVVEFGSGASTLLIAKVVQQVASADRKVSHVAIEHDEKYLLNTSKMLQAYGLQERVELVLCPIVEFAESHVRKYYDCDEVLRNILLSLPAPANIFVFVDGPPGALAKNSREPALDVLLCHFKGGRVTLLLDDFDRHDEKETAQSWLVRVKEFDADAQLTPLRIQKGAALISFEVPLREQQ